MKSGNPKIAALLVADPQKAYKIIADAFDDQGGNAEATARELGVDKTTLYRWMKDHPTLKKKLARAREA